MSLQIRLSDLITAVATDIKQLRIWVTGSSSGNLTGLNTTDKTSLVAAINEVKASGGTTVSGATETSAGIVQIATNAETIAGTIDTDAVSPLKLQQKLTDWAQPKSANLTTLAGVVPGAKGLDLLATVDAPSAKTSLGLAAVASSGSASDITTGTLPSSVLPPIAINETFTAATELAMTQLTAQRGDMAIRSDLGGKFYILVTDDPTLAVNWKPLVSSSDVTSVAGKTGAVTLVKADVGLDQVDNTSDAAKPVSTAQQTAIDARLAKASNLSDLANVATARTNLSVYSQAELGNPETDLVAAYNLAKA